MRLSISCLGNLDIKLFSAQKVYTKYLKKRVLLIDKVKKNLSNLLDTPINRISIKATTNEKISFIGRGEGIAAEAIIQITNV